MKSEKLYEAITEIDERLVLEGESFRAAKKKKRVIGLVSSLAAVFVIVAALGFAYNSGFLSHSVIPPENGTLPGIDETVPENTPTESRQESTKEIKPVALAKASYPQMADYPLLGELDPRYKKWAEDRRNLRTIEVETDSIKEFSKKLMAELLTEQTDENSIASPLNLYIALGMLAETCDGNSRQQLLELLGEESIEALRDRANKIWQKNYRDDGAMKSIMASSLWLNSTVDYNKSTVNTIAENYYASVFRGTMGSKKYDKLLNDWLSENTDGMLSPDITMDYSTVMTIASAMVFSSKWTDEFQRAKTESGSFHAPTGDSTVSFMKASRYTYYYWGEKYSAISLSLNIGGQMWFILPDEGVDADEIFSDSQLLDLVTREDIYGSYENGKYIKVNMSIPKFDVKSERNVLDGLKSLGITDVTDSGLSDFSPLAANPEGMFIDKIDHGVRVKIDEEGVQAAAYTVIRGAGSAAPPEDEVDFVLDRSFAFVITLSDNVPLFAGVVNNP